MESSQGKPAGGVQYRQQLDRTLKIFANVTLTFGTLGPTATVFAFLPVVLWVAGSYAFIAFIIAAVFALCQGLVYSELGTAYPVAGGEYSMVGRVLGRPVGAVLFAIMVANYILVPSAFALAGGIYLGVVWPWAGTHSQLIGALIVLFAAGVAFMRIAVGWVVAAVFLGVELVAIPVLVVLGLVHAHDPVDRLFTAHVFGPAGPMKLTATAFLLGVTIAFFCYQGFGNAVIFSEETKHAKKRVGRAVMWTLLISVISIAIPAAAVLLGAPSLKGLLTSDAPLTYVLETLGGHNLDSVVSLFVFFAIVDAEIASVMAFGRVLWSSGRDNAWPAPISRALATVHPKLETPYVATSVLAAAIMILTLLSTIAAVVTFSGVVTLAFAGLMGLSAIVLRFKKSAPEDRYKLPLWPIPPLVLLVGCVVMASQQTLHDLWITLAIAGGFLLYYLIYIVPRRDTHWVMLDSPEEIEEAEGAQSRPEAAPAAEALPEEA